MAAVTLALVAGASAQEKGLADKSVLAYMDYAWSLTPKKFTKPNGTVVEIDKAQRDKMVVPVDTAREIILAGRMTAHAQLCELPDEQVNNYRSLMKREDLKKKWSEQQMIFINQLHLTTVMLLTGKIKLVEQDGNKQAVLEEGKAPEQKPCTEDQRKKVKDIVTAYVAAGPSLAATAAAPATTGAIAPASAAAPAAKTPASVAAPAPKKQ